MRSLNHRNSSKSWTGITALLTAILVFFPVHAQDLTRVTQPEVSVRPGDGENLELDPSTLFTPIASQAVHGRTAVELIDQLQEKHYSDVQIDDEFSTHAFDLYLDTLDGSRLYFVQEDIDRLENYRYLLDDTLKSGSVDPGFEIYNLYQQRLLERLVFAIDRVENNIAEMDFTVDEYLEIDREDSPFAKSRADLDELWRLRMKNSVLSLKLTGDTDEEIREKLSKRYRNQLNQVLKTNDRDVFQTYLSSVAKSVDPHTAYFSPRDSENFNMGLSLSLQGIGAQLTTEDDYTKVVELIKGGPAERESELKAGDRIIGIGQGVDGEIKDVVGMRLDDVVDQIRGEKGTTVRLRVLPAAALTEASAQVIAITRDQVKMEEQLANKEILELNHLDQNYKLGVIHLSNFYFDFEAAARGETEYNTATKDVRNLLEELKAENVDGVVVDLRNNGGGSLTEANQLVGLFIDTGATVQIRYSGLRNGFTRSYGDVDPGVAYDGPLAVLVNRTSASASEIFAGAIQDYQRGIVLGGQTFGKGTVQEIIPMDYGQVKLTRSKFYRVSGASTQHRGVVPDIVLPDFYSAYDDLGESSLDGALPWDTVRPVEYQTYFPIKQVLPELQRLHEQRAESSPDLIYLTQQIERSRKLRERDLVSLNETAVKAEREETRRQEFESENMRRLMKGLPLLDWEEEEQDAAEQEALAANGETPIAEEEAADEEEPEEMDPLLAE
ncbi:MAG: carboxy terminal-processing peptidase, partial [Pseudohongiellaceae bacterium]